MWHQFDFWKLLAGLGIFLFGMFLLEESVKKLSGKAFKKLIRRYTTGRFRSIASGMLATSLLQSSSAVSLMILAFAGAGIMSMENAIGVILGSNIGTTITSWIVATLGFKINIESFALPLIGLGGLGIIFLGRSEKYSHVSKLLVGFGFLFMGLDYMKLSVEVFTKQFDIPAITEYGILVYMGIGILLTAIMQSSSATIALILTALHAGILTFNSAASMVIGANVGTTVTILLGAIGAVQIKKRVAYSHFIFNVVTALVALAIMPLLVYVIQNVLLLRNDQTIGLALFHTIFNVLGVLIFLPFIYPFAALLIKFFPERKTRLTLFIDNTTTEVPDAAISALKKEVIHLIYQVLRYNLHLLHIDEKLIFSGHAYPTVEGIQPVTEFETKYENLKLLQAKIITFTAAIQTQQLSDNESADLGRFLHAARMAMHSAKALKDIGHNFEEFENADNVFLNEQYIHFRKRLVEAYLNLDKLMAGKGDADVTKEIFKILHELEKADKEFIRLTIQAVNKKQIRDIEVSTALVVNRAFFQSSKQIVLALRELLLDEEELKQFERIQDITEEL